MKIPSNRVSSVMKYFREQLEGLYEKEEIEQFIFYCFNEFMSFSRTDLLTRLNDTMSESMLLKFNFAVKDLKKYKPIQYILESTWFFGLKLKVDERVLIPRQETEELVDLIIKQNKEKQDQHFTILDIGTGSGCIPVALKKNLPRANVHALDISAGALEIARENALSNRVNINFITGDILQPQTFQLEEKLDVIVSNPPYVLHSEKNAMQANVLEYEPHLALFVNDEDPLLFYRHIIRFAKEKLKPGGKLYFEINEQQGEALVKLASDEGMKRVTLVKDINGKNRMMHAEC